MRGSPARQQGRIGVIVQPHVPVAMRALQREHRVHRALARRSQRPPASCRVMRNRRGSPGVGATTQSRARRRPRAPAHTTPRPAVASPTDHAAISSTRARASAPAREGADRHASWGPQPQRASQAARRGNAVDDRSQQIVGLAAFEQRIGRQRDTVTQRRQRDALDVIRRHEVAAIEQCDDTSGAHQRDRAARAGADRKSGPVARGAHDAHRVVDDTVIDALRAAICCSVSTRAFVQDTV